MNTQGLLIDCTILSEDEILALYRKAYDLLIEGKTYMSFDGEGTSFTSQFPIPVETMLSECRYALRNCWPDKYGHNCTQVRPFFV